MSLDITEPADRLVVVRAITQPAVSGALNLVKSGLLWVRRMWFEAIFSKGELFSETQQLRQIMKLAQGSAVFGILSVELGLHEFVPARAKAPLLREGYAGRRTLQSQSEDMIRRYQQD